MKASVDKEFSAMRRITEILGGLDEAEAARVLEYVTARARAPRPAPTMTNGTIHNLVDTPAQTKLL